MLIEEKVILDALAIRDTSAHDSTIVDTRWCQVKGFVVETTLNQTATVQVYGSRYSDFSVLFPIGTPQDISSNTFLSTDTYVPYIRVTATCSVAPASGTISIIIYDIG